MRDDDDDDDDEDENDDDDDVPGYDRWIASVSGLNKEIINYYYYHVQSCIPRCVTL